MIEIQHRDKLGREIFTGDCVAYPEYNHLEIGIIKKINPKMIRIKRVGRTKFTKETNKYPLDVIKVDGPEVSIYLLNYSG